LPFRDRSNQFHASPGAVLAVKNASVEPSGLHRGLLDENDAVVRGRGACERSLGTVQMTLRRRFSFSSTVVTT
jgi:hypothetical protein